MMKPSPKYQAAGFSLVEMMVAMAIGLIILAAVSVVLVNSKSNYTTQDSLARLQENARFAMQFITRDLRMAGHSGCGNNVKSVKNRLNAGGVAGFFYNPGNPNPLIEFNAIEGMESSPAAWRPSNTPWNIASLAGTDALAIRFVEGAPVPITADMANTGGPLQVAANSGLSAGDVVMITDCTTGDLFQITSINAGTIQHVAGGSTPGNALATLSKHYNGPGEKTTGARIMRFGSVVYYIGTGASTSPALFRQRVTTGGAVTPPEELVEGIERFEILYGVDNAGNPNKKTKTPTIYKKANDMIADEWGNVVSVRFGILARTLANTESAGKAFGTDLDKTTYDIDGDGNAANDFTPPAADQRYQRRVFRTTVNLRNLQ